MRIGINALYIRPGKMGGGEVHFSKLVGALTKLDGKNKYFVFVNKKFVDACDFDTDSVTTVSCNLLGDVKPFRVVWEQLILPFILKKYDIDIVHTFSQTGLIFAPCKSLMTIHDLQHHYYPSNFSLIQRLYLRLMIWITTHQSDKIITISNNSAKDILNLLKVPEHKVEVVYESSRFGNKPIVVSDKDKDRVRVKYGLDGKYILSVASILPHKNLNRLICAFNLIASNDVIDLVLVGMKLKATSEVIATIRSIGLPESRVKILGYVPDSDLPALYSMAELFAFPSLFEGFGLPALEAMTFGCPVVAANSTAIPEVVGNGALLADPFNPNDFADKMLSVLTDKQFRNTLIQKGFERIKQFSWEKSACKVLGIYEDTLNQRD